LKLLSLDIETIPNEAHVWGLFNQNIGLNQLMKPSEVLCFAAKWYDKEEIMFHAQTDEISKRKMVHKAWTLLDEADAVLHYNGKKFDIPHLNTEFVLQGYHPPSPFFQIDLMKEVKKNFRLPSYKLDFVLQHFGIGKKVKHDGHELWVGCMQNEPESWKKMQEYNKGDVLPLERLYGKIKPWIKQHPNIGHYIKADKPMCDVCGSTNIIKNGTKLLRIGEYQRYRCNNCGRSLKGRVMINNKADRDNLTLGV